MAPRSALIRKLALGGATALLALGALELGLRIAGRGAPRINMVHPDWGYGGRPGAETWHGAEGGALVRNNGRGFRDAERDFERSDHTVRVAVLGDSYVAAYQVATEERFTERLERLLETRLRAELGAPDNLGEPATGPRVEVLNFGVNGFGTAQELLVWRHEVSRYDPDIVLLAFFTGNDLANNVRALESNPFKAYFTLDGSGELRLDDRFREALAERERPLVRWLEAATDRSRLLQLARRKQEGERVPHGPRPFEPADPNSAGDYLPEAGLRDEVYRAPEAEDWREAWSVTEALLLAFRDEVQAGGAQFAVTSLSTGIQVHPSEATRARFAERLGVETLDYPDQRLASFGAEHGIPVTLLAPPLRERAETEQIYVHGFTNTLPGQGHWNSLGHETAAEVLCEALFPAVKGAYRAP